MSFARSFVALIGLAILIVGFAGPAQADEWRKDSYAWEVWRSDKGETWSKDRYGFDTWRSSTGKVCKRDRYADDSWRCN